LEAGLDLWNTFPTRLVRRIDIHPVDPNLERLSHDVNGIGYVGRAANLPSSIKAISIRPAPGYSAFAPNPTPIRTTDYCMARELFLLCDE
jgi:hypothetical protein